MRGRVEASANELAAWTLVVTSFLIGTFLRSSTIGSNDLGWRCFLPAQLILLLWGATVGSRLVVSRSSVAPQPAPRPWARGALATLLILGILGTAYEVFMLRMFPVLSDRGAIQGRKLGGSRTGSSANGLMRCGRPTKFSMRNCLLRQSCRAIQLRRIRFCTCYIPVMTPPLAIPNVGRPLAATLASVLCACRKLAGLFALPDGSNLDATCREYGIDAVVVENSDRVWREPSSWIWSRQPVVANDYVRAFRCGAAAAGIHR